MMTVTKHTKKVVLWIAASSLICAAVVFAQDTTTSARPRLRPINLLQLSGSLSKEGDYKRECTWSPGHSLTISIPKQRSLEPEKFAGCCIIFSSKVKLGSRRTPKIEIEAENPADRVHVKLETSNGIQERMWKSVDSNNEIKLIRGLNTVDQMARTPDDQIVNNTAKFCVMVLSPSENKLTVKSATVGF